jgi:uncharacterized protein
MQISRYLAVALFASLQAQAADPAKVVDIRKFFAVTNVEQTAFADIGQMMELQKQANPQIPAEFWPELRKALKPAELIERMVPVYDKHFTHEQIKAWIKFFESEPGQAFLKQQPAVLQESALAGQAYIQEVGGPILHRLKSK